MWVILTSLHDSYNNCKILAETLCNQITVTSMFGSISSLRSALQNQGCSNKHSDSDGCTMRVMITNVRFVKLGIPLLVG